MQAGSIIDIEKMFNDIQIQKRKTDEMPIYLIHWHRFYILFKGNRYRKDLDVVVQQTHSKNGVAKSEYAKFLWEKSCFK